MLAQSGIKGGRASHAAPPHFFAALPGMSGRLPLGERHAYGIGGVFLFLARAANVQFGRIDAFIPEPRDDGRWCGPRAGPAQAWDSVRSLVTHVVMPGGMDGREFARQAHQLRRSMEILLTSGFTPAAASLALIDDFTANLRSNPYRKEDLGRHVRLALDSHVLGSV